MTLLTVNTGSSSVRLVAFSYKGSELSQVATSHLSASDQNRQSLLRDFIDAHGLLGVTAIAHRVVHGGARFNTPCLLDPQTESEIALLSPLAPLHNPRALRWISDCREVLGSQVAQVAVFDTAFYAQLPQVAATYALPRDLCKQHGIRRFGFHGIAHQAMWHRWRELRPDVKDGGKVISLQLGSGCSITAIDCGQPRDTSMGFSPLEGLVMATRPGDVDVGALLYLQQHANMTAGQVGEMLNHDSGLKGVSGFSANMRELVASDKPTAHLAVELFCYRARKYLGAYLAVLGGTDAILFGGGIGENSAAIRERILSGMEWCGLVLDNARNEAATGCEALLSTPESAIEAWAIPNDEAKVLARAAVALLSPS